MKRAKCIMARNGDGREIYLDLHSDTNNLILYFRTYTQTNNPLHLWRAVHHNTGKFHSKQQIKLDVFSKWTEIGIDGLPILTYDISHNACCSTKLL